MTTKNNKKDKEECVHEDIVDSETELSEDNMETEERLNDAKEADDNQDADDSESTESVETEDANTKYLRLAADFQNFKRRTEQEKSDIYKYANEKFATGLLEVLDNFDRAIEQENQDTSIDENFLEGMKMIFSQLQNVLKQNGVEEIDALGKPFDPLLHHAVMTENTDEFESGEVTKVMQKGYTLKDKVIRPSMVAVAD